MVMMMTDPFGTKMDQRGAAARLALLSGASLLGAVLLGGCSSSFGGGDGPAPARTYVVLPNGTTEPVQTTTRPPSD